MSAGTLQSSENSTGALPAVLSSHIYEGHSVRSSRNVNGEPLFVARDVCDVLDISKHHDALARVPDWARSTPLRVEGEGGVRDMATLTEAGVYFLTLRSNKPEAEAFQKWVCTEVLPAIRREGQYRPPSPADDEQAMRLRMCLEDAAEHPPIPGQVSIRAYLFAVGLLPGQPGRILPMLLSCSCLARARRARLPIGRVDQSRRQPGHHSDRHKHGGYRLAHTFPPEIIAFELRRLGRPVPEPTPAHLHSIHRALCRPAPVPLGSAHVLDITHGQEVRA